MTHLTSSKVASTNVKNEEIDLLQVGAALKRQSRLIYQVVFGALAVSLAYALTTPKTWQGEFQIVLASEESNTGKLAAANTALAELASSAIGGSKDNLQTEVKVLESPSVLKPVFDFVRSAKKRKGANVDSLRFSDWRKANVEVDLIKGTSVLNIAYKDTDRSLIVPVIEQISQEYQNYSGRDRRRDITNVVAYLKQSIATISPKAEESMKNAQDYAITHGLGISDGMPSSIGETSSPGGGGSLETNRQQAQAKLLLLNQQLAHARAAGNDVVFQAPQLLANTDLYKAYQATEARLSDLRSRMRENDELVRNLKRQRQSLIRTLNAQTVGLLKGEISTAKSALISSTRPKEVVLRHRELVRKALRYDKTLGELESNLQIAQLEQAKENEPWELISKPSMLDKPISPSLSRLLGLGLVVGLAAGCGAALVVDRRSGKIFSHEELQKLLPAPMVALLSTEDGVALDAHLNLLARGTLVGSKRVGVIPVGLTIQDTQLQHLLSSLRQTMPHTAIHCSQDLVEAVDCDKQLLVTSLGAPSRSQLASLSQQLKLQGRPPAGWILLENTGVA